MKKFNLSILAAMLIIALTVTDLSAQTRISFARGKSSTTVSGNLGKRGGGNSIKKFVVSARAGQHLSVVVKSRGGNVYTNMISEEGERGPDMYYTLDADGDHEFIIENVGTRATKFTMIVKIR
ncbi:MAG: hypothetical protein H0U50_07825 [Pyrinomonadaceae bacterium]|nr:hypothetical protein [Pyrinomonadaceae bacterium]